jgi:NAD(P)-dependent dehydrogenase (short-subunit alcohol dehydrogenase family)
MPSPVIRVTGAAGRIGAAVCARTAADSRPLILLDRVPARLPDGATGQSPAFDALGPGLPENRYGGRA